MQALPKSPLELHTTVTSGKNIMNDDVLLSLSLSQPSETHSRPAASPLCGRESKAGRMVGLVALGFLLGVLLVSKLYRKRFPSLRRSSSRCLSASSRLLTLPAFSVVLGPLASVATSCGVIWAWIKFKLRFRGISQRRVFYPNLPQILRKNRECYLHIDNKKPANAPQAKQVQA